MKDQTRNLGYTSVRYVDVHLLDLWLSRLEYPTHLFWLLLWSYKKSSPNQCKMCDCTFAFRTWIPNTSILTFALIKQISRPYQCQMCGCTFAWHLALKTSEFPTHLWLLLWSNKKSRPYQCQMCGYTFAWHLAFKTWMPITSILTFATATTKQEYRVFSLPTEALAVTRWIFNSCAFKSSCQMEPFATHHAR